MTDFPRQPEMGLSQKEQMQLLMEVVAIVKLLNTLEGRETRLSKLQESNLFQKLSSEQQNALLALLNEVFSNGAFNQVKITQQLDAILNGPREKKEEAVSPEIQSLFLSLLVDLYTQDVPELKAKLRKLTDSNTEDESPVSNQVAFLKGILFDLEQMEKQGEVLNTDLTTSIQRRLSVAFFIPKGFLDQKIIKDQLNQIFVEKKTLVKINSGTQKNKAQIVNLLHFKNRTEN